MLVSFLNTVVLSDLHSKILSTTFIYERFKCTKMDKFSQIFHRFSRLASRARRSVMEEKLGVGYSCCFFVWKWMVRASGSPLEKILDAHPTGRRHPGRPRMSWKVYYLGIPLQNEVRGMSGALAGRTFAPANRS